MAMLEYECLTVCSKLTSTQWNNPLLSLLHGCECGLHY
uniref:Uncharacterized protein n=1 Tax=Anguilla anguilla TaxID=7936 RepID=A0A0E9PNG4_ANGAN